MQPKGLFKFLRLEGFVQNVKEYVENRIAIAKLEAKQKIADVGSTIAAMIPAALFGFFALIFLSLTLAMAINVWLNSRVWGFLIVGVIYGIGAAVMFSMRDSVWLKKQIVDGSTKFLKDNGKKEEEDASKPAPGYHAEQVEHKKVIFEETTVDGETESETYTTTATTTTDKDTYTAAADREPHTNAGATTTTTVRTLHNAAIIETETNDEDGDKEDRS